MFRRTMDDAEFKQATKANGKVVPEGFIADNWDVRSGAFSCGDAGSLICAATSYGYIYL